MNDGDLGDLQVQSSGEGFDPHPKVPVGSSRCGEREAERVPLRVSLVDQKGRAAPFPAGIGDEQADAPALVHLQLGRAKSHTQGVVLFR